MPGLRVIVLAARNYIRHQSANQAGSVAFSSVLAMFPLLIFVSAAAAFVGQPGAAAELASRIMEFAPPVVADALKPAIDQVLGQRSRALLTIGVLATIWTASSGTQAIRTALNRAYGVEQGLPFWKARIKVTLFTVIGTVGTVLRVQLGGHPALRLGPSGEGRRRRRRGAVAAHRRPLRPGVRRPGGPLHRPLRLAARHPPAAANGAAGRAGRRR